MDLIDRQAAVDALDVLCQEHRYKIPGKRETYSQYNEAWQDALDRAEGAIFSLPSAERHGQWIEENRNPRSWSFYCSVCHRTAYDVQPTRIKGWVKRCRYAYCPNCGARMDGEHDE